MTKKYKYKRNKSLKKIKKYKGGADTATIDNNNNEITLTLTEDITNIDNIKVVFTHITNNTNNTNNTNVEFYIDTKNGVTPNTILSGNPNSLIENEEYSVLFEVTTSTPTTNAITPTNNTITPTNNIKLNLKFNNNNQLSLELEATVSPGAPAIGNPAPTQTPGNPAPTTTGVSVVTAPTQTPTTGASVVTAATGNATPAAPTQTPTTGASVVTAATGNATPAAPTQTPTTGASVVTAATGNATPGNATPAAPTQTGILNALTGTVSTITASKPLQRQVQKIVPSISTDQVDIISSTTNGNLNNIQLVYNGTNIENITITGLEFKSGSTDYEYKNGTLTEKSSTTPITKGDLLSAAQYLAKLNLAFYTDPNQTHTFP